MKRIVFPVLVIFSCLFIVTNTAWANVELTINLAKTEGDEESVGKKTPEPQKSQILVDIGDTYFSYTIDSTKSVYDFANKKIITINLTSNVYTEDSLVSVVAFRYYELNNRLALGQSLQAANIDNNSFDPILSEHSLSLEQKKGKTQLAESIKNGYVYLSSNNKDLFVYSQNGKDVSPADKKMFIQFIRYVFGGHPKGLSKLSSDNIIPTIISVNWFDNSYSVYNQLTVTNVKQTPSKPFSPEGYKRGILPGDTDEFSQILNTPTNPSDFNMEKHLKLLQEKATGYYQKGEYLDSVLMYFEYNLTSGLPFPDTFQKQKTQLFKDQNVREFVAALEPKNKKEAESFVIVLENLEKNTKNCGYIIKISEANIYKKLGNLEKAKHLFYEALKEHPYITHAYIDVGSLYMSDYNMVFAWRCWDAARQIAPNHEMLRRIDNLEGMLYREYPEYF